MTKKDYIIIARVFNTTAKIWTDARAKWIVKPVNAENEVEQERIDGKIKGINIILSSMNVMARGLCHELVKDNPKFDAVRFMETCGLPEVKAGGNDKVVSEVVGGLEDRKHICTFNACKNVACEESGYDICKKHFLQGINN